MGPRLRKMYPYHPRRRTRGNQLHKQAIHDIKHRISADLNGYLVLLKEGNATQITNAQLKAKTDFLKHSEEMQHIAAKMGPKYVRVVRAYLDSVNALVHTSQQWIDDATMHTCYAYSEKLDRELAAA